jgi:ElaB/YqjD/DUF883 family membrane-anchored ribosome-binding protein
MRHKSGNGHHVKLEQFLADIKTVVRDGEDLIKTGATEVKQRALAGAKTTERMVRDRPYQSIGVVFGLGVLVGLMAAGMFGGAEEE